jgi:hypothetical protein
MKRRTVDGNYVEKNEDVYEIMYRYINAEASVAEPERRKASEIPAKVKIWVHKNNCQFWCDKINRPKPYQLT